MLMFFGYPKCSTCVNAKKFLAKLGHKMHEIDPSTHATASGRALAQDSAPRAIIQGPRVHPEQVHRERALPVGLHITTL